MNILMLLDAPFPTDVRVHNEAQALIEAGHAVSVLCVAFKKDQARLEMVDGIRVHRMRWHAVLFRKMRSTVLYNALYRWIWWRFISRTAQSSDSVHAIHVHDLPLAGIGRHAAGKLNARLVLDFHENYPAFLESAQLNIGPLKRYFFNLSAWRKYESRAVEWADKLIVVVDESRERFLNDPNLMNKLTVVSNTPSLSHFAPRDAGDRYDKGRYTLTFISGFNAHRGLEVLIEAMPDILKVIPNARLCLVGDGRNRYQLEERVAELALGNAVVFTGWVSYSDVPEWIAISDICLVPHLANAHTDSTIPHKLFQYMAMEKAVIVSDCRPLKRIVESSDCGLVFKSGDSRSFADKVIELHKSGRQQEMGQNGRQAVLTQYNWAEDAKRLAACYNSLSVESRSAGSN